MPRTDIVPLNPAQIDYIRTRSRPCMTISIPGSGKTTVAVEKMAQIVASDPAARVVAITFTKDAATGLQKKLALKVRRDQLSRCDARTFHSIAVEIFKAATARKDVTTTLLTKEVDRKVYANDAAQKCAFTLEGEPLQIIDKALATLPEFWSEQETKLVNTYMQRLTINNAADFPTVLHTVVLAMKSRRLPLLQITHLIVDEAQDLDRVQLEFALLHASAGVMVDLIGDDDQAIYAFKAGLGYEALTKFTQFADAKVIRLEENYRSLRGILDAAKIVIEEIDESRRLQKSLYASRGEGGHVLALSFCRREDEVDGISRLIATELFDEFGERRIDRATGLPATVAVLARNHGILDLVQAACKAKEDLYGIVRKEGKDLWDKGSLSVLLSALSSLVDGRDIVGLDLMLAWTGLDAAERDALRDQQKAQLPAVLGIFQPADRNSIKPEGWKVIKSLRERWPKWQIWARARNDQLLAELLDELTNWLTKFCPSSAKKDDRQALTTQLKVGAKVICALHGSLQDRLQFLCRKRPMHDDDRCVKLMTLHSSKGLEFSTVIIAGLEDDILPGTKPVDEIGRDEEVRLLYVGMTRAQNRLFMTWPKERFLRGYWLGDQYVIKVVGLTICRYLNAFDRGEPESSGVRYLTKMK
jgi:superfamily I DNA/RNA helicase